MAHFIDIFLHLDMYLVGWVQALGAWIYGITFLVIFAETGLVVTPLLPGDSLLFALGALSVTGGALSFPVLLVVLTGAGILGNAVNYSIGWHFGQWLLERNVGGRLFKPEYIQKTHEFYERHGGKAIVLGRFLPIIRTFVPFTAGLGKMSKGEFFVFNCAGCVAWVGSFVTLGHVFGNLPGIKSNFHYVIIAIIVISLLPAFFAVIKRKTVAC